MNACYVIAYDIGTTGNKSCLYRLDSGISLIAQASQKYGLTLYEDGGAEQNPLEWWQSMALTTKELLLRSGLAGGDITAVSFCSQMQGLVLVDADGQVLRPAMSYMDGRAVKQFTEWRRGRPNIAGVQAAKLLISLAETGVVAGSAKDPVFRYAWVREKEPEIFSRIYKWLDVKDYLVFKATGRTVVTEDSAFATLLYNPNKRVWSEKVCALHGVNPDHLARIIKSADVAGCLTPGAAAELGLSTDCKVIAGGGDSTLIGVGAGAAKVGDTHVYIGTSGWVSTVTDRRLVDVSARIATIVGAEEGKYNYFAEMETSGKCIEWARDNLALDSLGLYGKDAAALSGGNVTVIERMCAAAAEAPAGSGGVVFMPWLLGNRCPFEDADCQGGFFNVGLRTGKRELVRSVLEGILMHKRWMLDRQSEKIPTSGTLRIAGGGARSPVLCQMLADITGRTVEQIKDPQNAGAMGAAILMAASLNIIDSLEKADALAVVDTVYEPDALTAAVYEKNYRVFKRLYFSNRLNFRILNARTGA